MAKNQMSKSTGKMTETGNAAQALSDIVAWSQGCPDWQRDTLRRLCTKGELDDSDINELTEICKLNGKDAIPLSAAHVTDSEKTDVDVKLKKIHGTENINGLKPGESLTFDKKGLTIVYGDNGTGKSGYTRILKKVCGARVAPNDDEIYPNIYARKAEPQKAVVDFIAKGKTISVNWPVDGPGGPLMSAVSVFDSRTASVHVNEVNEFSYKPIPMLILERLAETCTEINKRIKTEIQELKQQTPEAITAPKCHEATKVGRLIADLSSATKEEDVRALARMNDKDKAWLDELRVDQASDPAKAAGQIEDLRNRLDAATDPFESLQNAVRDTQIRLLKGRYKEYITAHQAALAAADKLFSDDPLPDIGSEVWRALWEAARCYSEQQVYPNSPFPVTESGARCVLCQQELNEEASKRFNRFEAFVNDETKRMEEQAKAAYDETRSTVDNADVANEQISALVSLIRNELVDNELATLVQRVANELKLRRQAVLQNHTEGEGPALIPVADAWPAKAIATHRANLSDRINAWQSGDESEERKKMRAKYAELEDRAWLAVVENDVIAEIGRLQKRAELEVIAKDTVTTEISRKSGRIAHDLITEAFRTQFSLEIEKFNVVGLAVELCKEKTERGVPHFQIKLTKNHYARVGKILSEGEHRCVALAAFFAEVAMIEGHSAIVFDDPVSSLDQNYREAVTNRLAEEGQHRQTVVFTHDIAFLFLLDQACRDKGTQVAYRSVTRTEDHSGIVQQDPPVRAQPTEKVIKGMQRQIDNTKHFYESGEHDKWEETVDAVQKRLRSTWERAVEDAVGPVIKRLSNKVETKGLAKLTALTMDDCKKMRQAYRRCSVPLHSSPDVLAPSLPTPGDIQKQIKELRTWIKKIKQRQAQIH